MNESKHTLGPLGILGINECTAIRGFYVIGPKPERAGEGSTAYCAYKGDAILYSAAPAMYEACRALIDAPHYDHFAARMNDEELAAIEKIKAALALAEATE